MQASHIEHHHPPQITTPQHPPAHGAPCPSGSLLRAEGCQWEKARQDQLFVSLVQCSPPWPRMAVVGRNKMAAGPHEVSPATVTQAAVVVTPSTPLSMPSASVPLLPDIAI